MYSKEKSNLLSFQSFPLFGEKIFQQVDHILFEILNIY